MIMVVQMKWLHFLAFVPNVVFVLSLLPHKLFVGYGLGLGESGQKLWQLFNNILVFSEFVLTSALIDCLSFQHL